MTARRALADRPAGKTAKASQRGRNKAKKRRLVADHPEWRAYLESRCILEPVIAAGTWVEWDSYARQDALVWREKRRDGGPGATRRRLLNQEPSGNGTKQAKSRWQVGGEKTDEPFYYIGALDSLREAISAAGGSLRIVEGEVDVWSLRTLGFGNVIGMYGINEIPRDIGCLFDELGISQFVYFADNDAAGDRGASRLHALLHESGWNGEGTYRKVAGAGIPDKGDVNDLLRQHHRDPARARAALDALPEFQPKIRRKPARQSRWEPGLNSQGWEAVKEAIRTELGVMGFNRKGYSKNFSCPNPKHTDRRPSAGWHRDGYCKCFTCGGTFNAKTVAEWLGIDLSALLGPWRKSRSARKTDLNAAPLRPRPDSAPPSFEQPPDTWLKLLRRYYTTTDPVLFHFAMRLCRSGPLAEGFTIQEFIRALRSHQCEVSERAIYNAFQDARDGDNHPVFAKLDVAGKPRSWNCKFRLRSLSDIRDRLALGIRYRVYEKQFHRQLDTLIGSDVFAEAPLGSEYAKALQFSLGSLYLEQRQRYERLARACEDTIADCEADLHNYHATPLPLDCKIKQPADFLAMLARAIYEAEPQDRSRTKWAELLGISKASVGAVLERVGIQRRAYTVEVEVDSADTARSEARERDAKIMGIGADGSYLRFDVTMDIAKGSTAILQPPAEHSIVSAEQPPTKSASAQPRVIPAAETVTGRAAHMERPGNWHKPAWDPQFIYWELVKACRLLHGFQLRDGVGIYDPSTGEVWENPTLPQLASLVIGPSSGARRDVA